MWTAMPGGGGGGRGTEDKKSFVLSFILVSVKIITAFIAAISTPCPVQFLDPLGGLEGWGGGGAWGTIQQISSFSLSAGGPYEQL